MEDPRVPYDGKLKSDVKFGSDASDVQGYYTIAHYTGVSCNSNSYYYLVGYKAATCLPMTSGSGSYMITLISPDSCVGGYMTYYSDIGCQQLSSSVYLSETCYYGQNYACYSDVYAPADSWYSEIFLSYTSSPECTDSPDLYTSYALNYCTNSGGSLYKYQCSSQYVVTDYYSDSSCTTYSNEVVSGALDQCSTGPYYGYNGAFQYKCHTTDYTDSSSTEKKNAEINQISLVFIVIGILVFLFSIVIIVRWWRRRNQSSTSGDVKMITLFTKESPLVKYSAAPTEMRI